MLPRRRSIVRRREAGFTLAELVMVAAVLAILAAVTLPVAKFTAKRSKEADLQPGPARDALGDRRVQALQRRRA